LLDPLPALFFWRLRRQHRSDVTPAAAEFHLQPAFLIADEFVRVDPKPK